MDIKAISIINKVVPPYGEYLVNAVAMLRSDGNNILQDFKKKTEITECIIAEKLKEGLRKSLINFKMKLVRMNYGDFIPEIIPLAIYYRNDDMNYGEKTINIKGLELILNEVWPKIVISYIEKVESENSQVIMNIRLKSSLYENIYGKNNDRMFIKELDGFLGYQKIKLIEACKETDDTLMFEISIWLAPTIDELFFE
ncbi:MAG: hypothetical protein PHR25_06780 [Clostridia bacterium]|nr:hypothetical protein [Clostridia bacterium]MDD4376460.1 hypothetical protein [Clostridia bacterium]